MTYSLSTKNSMITKGPQVAMKLFYKYIVDISIKNKLLDDEAVEEISLPENVLGELMGLLRDSNELLPASVRRFQDWDVGLLDRYDIPRVKG